MNDRNWGAAKSMHSLKLSLGAQSRQEGVRRFMKRGAGYLLATACDEIMMPPVGRLTVSGVRRT